MAAYHVQLRFYEELNDFLPRDKQRRTYEMTFDEPRSVKDLLESEGVPHTEIDLILVNGESVGFDYLVADGDRISVYPMFERFDIAATSRLDRPPLREPRFVADVHCGKLTRNLRLLGFDVLYRNDWEDADLARVSHDEHRILLTRDVGLLKRSNVTHGVFLHTTDPLEQAREVIARLDLQRLAVPFSRCLRCNGLLRAVDAAEVVDRLPSHVAEETHDFRQCTACGQPYWKGAHWPRLQTLIREMLDG